MSVVLRHQVLDDAVLISFVNGGRPQSTRVSETEAKRFAWSLLNDLSPEDADPPLEHVNLDTRGNQRFQILLALEQKPRSTEFLCHLIRRDRAHAASVLCSMRGHKGLVATSAAGFSGQCAVWEITAKGIANLARRRAAQS